jgi:enamine deaminase RidA (YjgF/YER057c/UK114 family)
MAERTDIRRLDQNGRRSRAVIPAGVVHLAGQVADDPSGDIALQTRTALAEVDDLLAQVDPGLRVEVVVAAAL